MTCAWCPKPLDRFDAVAKDRFDFHPICAWEYIRFLAQIQSIVDSTKGEPKSAQQ